MRQKSYSKTVKAMPDTLRQMCFGIWLVMCNNTQNGCKTILHGLFVSHRHIILCVPLLIFFLAAFFHLSLALASFSLYVHLVLLAFLFDLAAMVLLLVLFAYFNSFGASSFFAKQNACVDSLVCVCVWASFHSKLYHLLCEAKRIFEPRWMCTHSTLACSFPKPYIQFIYLKP